MTMSTEQTEPSDGGPTDANLAAEVAALRDELAALRESIAAGITTRNLTVVDEHGAKRITTSVDAHRTVLEVMIVDAEDRCGFGAPTESSATLTACLGSSDHADGNETARATVELSTGDDSYAILEQLQVRSEDGRRVVERGNLDLYQQRSRRDSTGRMVADVGSDVRVGRDGVVEHEFGGDVVAHSPLVRVPGS